MIVRRIAVQCVSVDRLDLFVWSQSARWRGPLTLVTSMKRYGRPEEAVTDPLRPSRAAMRERRADQRQVTGRHESNRPEYSHAPFRRGERVMTRFRAMRMKTESG